MLCTVVIVELTQVRLMIISLKKVGASLMTVTVYISNFTFTS